MPDAADTGSYLSRLLTAPPTMRAALLSHDSTKLYTGVIEGLLSCLGLNMLTVSAQCVEA